MRVLILAALVLGATWTPAMARAECPAVDQEALRWLDKMSHSLMETSYQGVFTYQHGKAVQSMRISHSVAGNMVRKEMTHLTGKGARVMRAEHPLDRIHPGNRLVRIGEIYRSGAGECGVGGYYQLKVAGNHRVAGRDAVIINVLPRDIYRYGYQLALDRETGLLLKTQTVAQDGRVLERFQFSDIKIGDVDTDGTHIDPIDEAGDSRGATPRPALSQSPAWNVAWLPAGFMLTEEKESTNQNRCFTDGLAMFSVFLEPAPEMTEPGAGLARRGGTTVYTRGMTLSGRPVLVTVLGEVPVNTARRVAESLVWAEQPGAASQ